MDNTINNADYRLNTTDTDFEILTGIDKFYITELPEKEELPLPERDEDE